MALIEISLPASIAKALRLPVKSPRRQQLKVLKKLLKKARFTEFGQTYRFDEMLLARHPGKKFQQRSFSWPRLQFFSQPLSHGAVLV